MKSEEVTIETSPIVNNKNIRIQVTHPSSFSNDDSIIDVTNQSYKINSNNNLTKYRSGVPYWTHQYVYSFSEIRSGSAEQIQFYRLFKNSFLKGVYFDLEGNTNYAFFLLFDLLNEYDNHKDLLKLEGQLTILGQCYPKTKSYGSSFLIQKMEQAGYRADISRINKEDSYNYPNYNTDYDYYRLGSKYKSKLNLNEEEVKLLNKLWYPNNNFCNIEFCCIEVLKLYLSVISELKAIFITEGTNIEQEFLSVADVIARKHYRYRSGSQNYRYCIDSTINEIYTNIFKYCENAIREIYGHTRKLNTDINYLNGEVKTVFEDKIVSKLSDLIPILVLKVAQPDEATEIELYSQNTNRWKKIFQKLTTNYNGNLSSFLESIIILGRLNKKNPSVENIFFEASKFIARFDKESSLILYIHYLFHDLKSAKFDNKQLTKTIQKSLFKTNEQLHDFEKIVSELLITKNLEQALIAVPKIYEVKLKKIQLDKSTIKEVQQQHSGTVELLNEYLRDEYEDENNAIKSEEINNDEIAIEIIQKNEALIQSPFLKELSLQPIHVSTLELFSKNNFSILQSEIEDYAKSKGVFKNQLIESINETCFEVLDDILIEEEEDYYSINQTYFQIISVQ